MFIKTIVKTDKKTGKRYDYYRLCEGYRIGDKVRHRTIVTMGKLEGIDSKEDKKFLADLIETLVKGDRQLFSFKVKPEIEKYASQFANRIINENLLDIAPDTEPVAEAERETDIEPVDINSIKHEDVREIGSEWLCKQAMDQLNLKNILTEHCGFSNTSANIALTHIASRAVYPASEHKTAQWIKENSAVAGLFDQPLDKVNRFKLYAASNNLYNKKNIIEQWLSTKTNELFDLQDKIIFYDLTNTYFEGRKANSKKAKFGRSKEKRSDAKIVTMATVINAEGFLKYNCIYEGNISDNKTLAKTVEELGTHTSSIERKPVIVMDAGIMTDENATMLKEKGYDYICVTRTKLKNYKPADPGQDKKMIFDRNDNPISLQLVEKEECEDTYMYVHSQQKAAKEASMNDHFSQRYEEDIENIRGALGKKGGTKKLQKVWERIGRLKERYPTANRHYTISVVPDDENENAIDIKWEKNAIKPKESEGVYFIRTSLDDKQEETLWTIYNTLTEIEATFRVLKTDLALRPVFHKHDENVEAHLFLGLIAYQVVATIRYQLKQKGIRHDWRNIVRIMNTHKEVTSTMKCKSGKVIMIKKCSTPSVEARQIYDALGYKYTPYFMKKSVVPEK
ncbi:MAG: IS1634 family transposase [Bacteroidota bacterium]